jgi:hypothetical protein
MPKPLVVVADENVRRITTTHVATDYITITVNKGIIEGRLNGITLTHLKGSVTMTVNNDGTLQVSLIGYASGGRPRIIILGSRGVLEAIVPRVRRRNRRVIVIGRDIVSLLMAPDAVRVWFNPDSSEAYAVGRLVRRFLGYHAPMLGVY